MSFRPPGPRLTMGQNLPGSVKNCRHIQIRTVTQEIPKTFVESLDEPGLCICRLIFLSLLMFHFAYFRLWETRIYTRRWLLMFEFIYEIIERITIIYYIYIHHIHINITFCIFLLFHAIVLLTRECMAVFTFDRRSFPPPRSLVSFSSEIC